MAKRQLLNSLPCPIYVINLVENTKFLFPHKVFQKKLDSARLGITNSALQCINIISPIGKKFNGVLTALRCNPWF